MTRKGQRILLVNLPFEKLYAATRLSRMRHSIPPMSLAALGGSLVGAGHQVAIFDFNLADNTIERFRKLVTDSRPGFIGISFVTPLFYEMARLASLVKEIHRDVVLIGGGPHCSTFPEQSLADSQLDLVVKGEGDFLIRDIVEGGERGEKRFLHAAPIANLDDLPFPSYQLYELRKYRVAKSIARKLPAAWMETSRGCVYNCVYCNKNIHGERFRAKSPERVLEEIVRLKAIGVREVHFADDAFTTDRNRAKRICDLIARANPGLNISLINGIRVNQVDRELAHLMKKAGIYKVFFGIESGNQAILDNIRKGATIDQVVRAVEAVKTAGIEAWGSFMIGLPGETADSMRDTIDLAKKLPLDLAKMSIHIPLPGTPIYDEWKRDGFIKSERWEMFNFHTPPVELYDHPNLGWGKIIEYHNRFYNEFYFRPRFIARRIAASIRNGMILDDLGIFLRTKWT